MKRSLRPGIEGLEGRSLSTVMGIRGPSPDLLSIAQSRAAQVSPQATVAAPTPPVPPIIPGPGQPLPIELKRTRFVASFAGPFQVGPPHYTGESALLYYRGLGTSSEFLHGNYQMIIVLPKDPTGDITGAAFLEDKNLVGGNSTGFDINFDRSTLDSKGRPTQGTFATDPNIYSGTNLFNQGSGSVTIRYTRTGLASAFFKGQNFTNGITNILLNTDLRPRGSGLSF
jgi:hypothetical protein